MAVTVDLTARVTFVGRSSGLGLELFICFINFFVKASICLYSNNPVVVKLSSVFNR